jgi:imidazolonepropionase-like amidohydrolase
MQRAGVPILAGTDEGDPYVFAGFSLHDELALLVQAGLTPLEALRTATLNPAAFLKATDSLGTIEPGKLADLVLLEGDPLANIRNTAKVRAVVANGRYLDRGALDALLATAEGTGSTRQGSR